MTTVSNSMCDLAMKFLLKQTSVKSGDILVNGLPNNTTIDTYSVPNDHPYSIYWGDMPRFHTVTNRCNNGVVIEYFNMTKSTKDKATVSVNTKDAIVSIVVTGKHLHLLGIYDQYAQIDSKR